MKRIFIMLLLCAATLELSAAQPYYVDIVREGVQWVYGVKYVANETHTVARTTMTIEFKGDTVINGKKWKKCYRTFGVNDYARNQRNGNVYEITTDPMLIAFCREGGGTREQTTYAIFSEAFRRDMYFIGRGINTYEADCMFDDPNMVYLVNFYVTPEAIDNMIKKHETPLSYFYDEIPLTRTQRETDFNFTHASTVEINGITRHVLSNKDLNNYTGGYYTVWVEGIGLCMKDMRQEGIHGGIFISPFAHFRTLDATTFLNHVVENGEIVYKGPEYDDSFNVTSPVGDVKVPQIETADNNYYNLMGQPVAHPEDAPGIYIHEGKKIVVK